MAYNMYRPGYESGSYYGGVNNSTECFSEEYKRQEYGSNPGAAGYMAQRPHHHIGHAGYNSGIGSGWATEAEKVTEYYETSGSRHGNGIGGFLGSRPERKTHHRRRVVKQSSNGGFYSCSESDSSDDEIRRRVY